MKSIAIRHPGIGVSGLEPDSNTPLQGVGVEITGRRFGPTGAVGVTLDPISSDPPCRQRLANGPDTLAGKFKIGRRFAPGIRVSVQPDFDVRIFFQHAGQSVEANVGLRLDGAVPRPEHDLGLDFQARTTGPLQFRDPRIAVR